jgi:hypothetical protein
LTRHYRGYDIVRRAVRTAYARNGNMHNPTVTYAYDVKNGTACVFVGMSTLRKAKLAIDEMIEDLSKS